MRAMRDAPSAAAVLGVNIARLKVKVFVECHSRAFAGSLFAHYVSFVNVNSFGIDRRAITFLLIAVLGGVRTIAGTVLGALFVTALPNFLDPIGDVHDLLFAVLRSSP